MKRWWHFRKKKDVSDYSVPNIDNKVWNLHEMIFPQEILLFHLTGILLYTFLCILYFCKVIHKKFLDNGNCLIGARRALENWSRDLVFTGTVLHYQIARLHLLLRKISDLNGNWSQSLRNSGDISFYLRVVTSWSGWERRKQRAKSILSKPMDQICLLVNNYNFSKYVEHCSHLKTSQSLRAPVKASVRCLERAAGAMFPKNSKVFEKSTSSTFLVFTLLRSLNASSRSLSSVLSRPRWKVVFNQGLGLAEVWPMLRRRITNDTLIQNCLRGIVVAMPIAFLCCLSYS